MGCFRIRVGDHSLDVHRVAVAVETADQSVSLYKEPAAGVAVDENAPSAANFLGYVSETRTVVRLADDHGPCEASKDLAGEIERLYQKGAQ